MQEIHRYKGNTKGHRLVQGFLQVDFFQMVLNTYVDQCWKLPLKTFTKETWHHIQTKHMHKKGYPFYQIESKKDKKIK